MNGLMLCFTSDEKNLKSVGGGGAHPAERVAACRVSEPFTAVHTGVQEMDPGHPRVT